jgi:transcription antitermination factor NusG
MTSTAVVKKAIAKRAIAQQVVAEAALLERFSETVKLEVNEDGRLNLDKNKVKALKKFQKDKLKTGLSTTVPVTILASGVGIPIALEMSMQEMGGYMFVVALMTSVLSLGSSAIVGHFWGKRKKQRNSFLAKNSETVVKGVLLERGIVVNQETLTAVTQNVVNMFTQEGHDSSLETYATTEGDNFRFRRGAFNTEIELVQTATPATKQKVLETTTQLPSDIATVNQIKNKTFQLSTQQLSAEKAYTFTKAQKDTQKALKLAQQLQELGDENWKQALEVSLQPINTDLETLIEECRNEKRQQLANIRS